MEHPGEKGNEVLSFYNIIVVIIVVVVVVEQG